jgi:hypothetical protein
MAAWLSQRRGLLAGAAAAVPAFVVYWLTLARDLTFANFGVDGGDLITAVLTRGVPHPSGYPLYLLLGQLAARLPLSPAAFRFNLLSALSMAAAIGFVSAASIPLFTRRETAVTRSQFIAASAAGLTLAFSTLFWGQALIAEVYGLYMLFMAACLWALFTERPPWLTGLLLGLTITSHQTGWLLLPLVILITHHPSPTTHHASRITHHPSRQLTAGLLTGLLPFALLPWLAAESSPVVWGDLKTVAGWWWLVSSQLYRGYLFGLPPENWLPRFGQWAALFGALFTWAGIPLILSSFFLVDGALRRRLWGVAGTAVLYLLFAFSYLPNDAIILTLPAWLLLSLLLFPAYQRLNWLSFLLPLALLLLHFQAQNLSEDRIVRRQTEALLTAVPPQAIIETPGDATQFALLYFIYGEGQRMDIVPVDETMLAFDWYRQRLRRLHPHLNVPNRDDLDAFRTNNRAKRPYCFASLTEITESNPAGYTLSCS